MTENSMGEPLFQDQLAAIQAAKMPRTTRATPILGLAMQDRRHPQVAFQGRQLGLIVMAGGQATRLNAQVPKGVLPFEPKTGKSLFARIADRVKEFGRLYGKEPFLAIMTSDCTDQDTRQHFSEHEFFGLQNVSFFLQPSLPLITLDEAPAVDSNGKPLLGPDGNGSIFASFAASGLLQQYIDREVQAVSIVMVDNPLLDPFHPDLCLPICLGGDAVSMTAGAIARTDPGEQVGLFARVNEKITVLEYSEIDPVLQQAKASDGSLLYSLANISFFVTTTAQLALLSKMKTKLHAALKNVGGQKVWKCEYFVFDFLPFVRNVEVVLIDRGAYFAPVKDPLSLAQARLRLEDGEPLQVRLYTMGSM